MRLITLDWETYYDKTYSLSKMTTESYIRSPQFQPIGFGFKINDKPAQWVTGDEARIAAALKKLDIPNSYLLCHHTAFDGAILSWRYGIQPKYYLDTMSMARPVVGPAGKVSLAALAEHFKLGVKGKEVVHAFGLRREAFPPEQLAAYGEYCKNDVELTYAIFNELRKGVPQRELYVIDLLMRMYCDPVLTLDREVLTSHLAAVLQRKSQFFSSLTEHYWADGTKIDTEDDARAVIMSNPKFAALLRTLGVEPPTKVSVTTGEHTFAFAKTDDGLKALLAHEDERVQTLAAARIGAKSTIEQSRTESFLQIAARGSLPVPISYYAAHTGRGGGWDGINLQNLPRGGELRRAIRAPKGHMLVAVDSSQIEARMTGWLAGEVELTADFANNVDIYSKFATNIFSYEVKKATHPKERFVGKTGILGLGFGCGAAKFQTMLKNGTPSTEMELPECKRIVNIYRATYPEIVALWAAAGEYLDAAVAGHEHNFGVGVKLVGTPEGIRLPNGLMVRYPGLRKEDGELVYDTKRGPTRIYGAKVTENVVQALARIVVFDQMAKVDKWLRGMDNPGAGRRFRVVSTVHDEVICCVPEDFAQECHDYVVSVMSDAPVWASGLPVSCEGAVGRSYADCK